MYPTMEERPWRITAFLLSFALATSAGCGGGGGNDRPTPYLAAPATTAPSVPEPDTQRRRFAPVHGQRVNEAFIDGYLDAIAGPVDYEDGGQALLRWRRPPVIKYTPGFARSSIDAVEGLKVAVSMVNHGLPREMQVRWGGSLGAEKHALSEDDAEGLIIVGIGDFQQKLGSGLTLGSASMVRSPTIDSGVLVGLDPDAIERASSSGWAVFVHEIIHAMGLWDMSLPAAMVRTR